MPVKSVKTPKIGKANREKSLGFLSSDYDCKAQLLTPYRKHETPLQAKALLTFGLVTAHFDPAMGKMSHKNMTQKDKMTPKAHFAKNCALPGLRPTRQRVAIAALLLDGRHRHVTADSLIEEITTAWPACVGRDGL
jgi:hypothetical protein